MRPEWRLAISNLSERRSRTALLVATVALSAALIAAVACAMNSVQSSARRQVLATVGAADAVIRPITKGQPLPEGVVALAGSWAEVARARSLTTVSLQVRAALDTLVADPDGTYTPQKRRYASGCVLTVADALSASDAELLDGRWPTAPDEIVVDATLAVSLSPGGADAVTPMGLPARRGGQRTILSGPKPQLPEETADAVEAARLNALVGVRIGDEIEAARRVLPQINMSAVIADPAKAAEMARASGVEFSPAQLLQLFQSPVKLRVVGVSKPPPFGGRPRAFATPSTLELLTGKAAAATDLELTLREGVDPESFTARRRPELPPSAIIQTSAKVTSGLDRNIQASRLGFLLATAMAFLCAAFIITTAMTTGVTERQRELGILRCIGADKGQLARSQLMGGLMIGLLGAAIGVPLGVLLAAGLVEYLQTQIEVRLEIPWWGAAGAGLGSLAAGLAGAAYPAVMASRVSPLEALAARAVKPHARGVGLLLGAGLVLALVQLFPVTVVEDGQWRFWLYVFVGLPALFFAYFALSVPAVVLVTRIASSGVARLMGVPAALLSRTLAATPYRYGFTAGSMMMGLSLMVGIWTQGSAIQRDWLGRLAFPDAFVTGLNIDAKARDVIDALPFVTDSVAIAIQPVETDTFGVRALQSYRSTFMGFEPEPFFRMVRPVWVQGNEAEGIRRLNQGGAIIVGREFVIARNLRLGDTFVCRANGREHAFEIVGVVTSPGLEVVSQFFSIGEEFSDQAMHAVFGSRRDLKEKFGNEAIHLIQIALAPGTDDAEAISKIKEVLAGAGVLEAGSGRQLKEQLDTFISGALLAFSAVAVVSMLIAGFGVANLIIAGITARRYEFGVLQAVGAARTLVTRLVLSEAVVIGLTAALLGTCMGLQGVYAIQRIDEKLFGLELHLRPPMTPLFIGWCVTMVMTLAAAAPAVLALARKRPRELLASVRG